MARVLYIADEVLPGLPELRGKALFDHLRESHQVELTGSVLPDDHEWLTDPRIGKALIPEARLSQFDALVIEGGWKCAGGDQLERLNVETAADFVRHGGQLIVADVDILAADRHREELLALGKRFRVAPCYGDDGHVMYLHDDLDRYDNGSSGTHVYSFPAAQMQLSEWLTPVWADVESVLVSQPIQLVAVPNIMASGTRSTEVLHRDRFVESTPFSPWASVTRYGEGHFVMIGAGITADSWVRRNPQNARWIRNVVEFLCEETKAHNSRTARIAPRSGPSEVEGLLRQSEGQRLERKASFLASRDPRRQNVPRSRIQFEVGRAIAGMANSDGGHVIIGQTDDGEGMEIVGLADDFKLLTGPKNRDTFQQSLYTYLKPRLTPGWAVLGLAVHWLEVDNKHVAIIEVPAHRGEPVTFRSDDEEDVFVRTGTSTTKLTVRELIRWVETRRLER